MKAKSRIFAAVVICLGLIGGWPAGLQAGPGLSTPELIEAARARGEIDQITAYRYLAYALGDYQKLPSRYHSAVGWDGTLPLLRLQEAMRTMKASLAREEIVTILSGFCGSSSAALPNAFNSSHFYIEYNTIGGGLTVNQYATSLETAWTQEVTSFGWAAPPLNSNPPPGNRYHVRVDSLGVGLYGYVTNSGVHAGLADPDGSGPQPANGNNPNTAWNDGDAYATCMVLNRDYSGFPGSAQQALNATAAHEFNHSIQFGYGALTGANAPDNSLVEAGASWMEDEVFDNANDNYNYLWPQFSMCMGEYTASPYPYWITLRGLTERYGTGVAGGGEQVMQDFWVLTSQSSSSTMLSDLNTALMNKGTNLADAYHAYAIAVKFNKTCGGGYVYPYCFEEAAGYLARAGATAVHGSITSIGGSYIGNLADNYALNWISLPTGTTPYTVTLQNSSAGGQLRGSLVCDTGAALNITALPAVVGAGASTTRANYNPTGCSSIVAVVTNQAQTAANPTGCTTRSYALRTSRGGGGTPAIRSIFLPLVFKSAAGGGAGGILNGDFESGPTDWTEYSTHGWDLIVTDFPDPVTPHSGSWAVWLGGDLDEISFIRQQVTVPAGSPYLAYWHWIASADVCGYDFGGVVINDSTVVDVYDLCSARNTGGWVQHVVNLGAYAGQSVSLQIRAEADSSLNSNLFVDDVSFQASARSLPGGPTVLDVRSAVSRSGTLAAGERKTSALEGRLLGR